MKSLNQTVCGYNDNSGRSTFGFELRGGKTGKTGNAPEELDCNVRVPRPFHKEVR